MIPWILLERMPNFPDYGDVHRFDPHREGGHLLPRLNMLVKGENLWNTETPAQLRYAFGYRDPPELFTKKSARRHVYAAGFFVSLGLFYKPIMPEIVEMYLDFEEVLTGIKSRIEKDKTAS